MQQQRKPTTEHREEQDNHERGHPKAPERISQRIRTRNDGQNDRNRKRDENRDDKQSAHDLSPRYISNIVLPHRKALAQNTFSQIPRQRLQDKFLEQGNLLVIPLGVALDQLVDELLRRVGATGLQVPDEPLGPRLRRSNPSLFQLSRVGLLQLKTPIVV